MSGQVAKLFIRGSLVNVTAKNLDKDQHAIANELMQLAWNDPGLESAKTEFCSILKRTIGNEYLDKEFALEEALITFWRTAVDVLYHNVKPQVVSDPFIRRKHFKHCLYNYMRQILMENKIPSCTVDNIISGPADQVASQFIELYLQNSTPKINYHISQTENTVYFHFDTRLVPIDLTRKIKKLNVELKNTNATITIENDGVQITSNGNVELITKSISEKRHAKLNSIHGFDDDSAKNNFQQHCEFKAVVNMENNMDTFLVDETISTLSDRLTDNGKKVLALLIDPPNQFLDMFYPKRKKDVRPKEIHMAQWLGLTKDEVSQCMVMIQKQAIALDVT